MTDVLVVGGGIIGLTAAVRLQQRGARVTVWAADPPEATVSAVAAAVWYPTRTEPDPRVLGWAGVTLDAFRRDAAAGVPGVLMRHTRMLLRDPPDRLPWWAPAVPDVAVAGAPAPYVAELTCTLPLVEMGTYLGGLVQRITGAGGRVVRRRVDRLGEALTECPVVVNATGLAAGVLCRDAGVFPVRGQVVLVANPGLDVSVRDEGNPAGVTYVHPRTREVVLGGTYQPNDTDPVPDPGVREAILARCRALVPQLADAPVVGERVGLRPARRGGPRVEAETVPGGRLVHAYGHGGAGMTLAWGCADEVADLALGEG
jgi:D-amino-acid oxidase